MTSKQSNEPRKVRWTVPAVDTSVITWLEAQQNISHSLGHLIRESIQRDGYIDAVYRPVEQQPRRGRPPQVDDLEPAARPAPAPAPEVVPAPAAPVSAPVAATEPVVEPVSDPTPPVEPVQPESESHSSPAEPQRQLSIDEIMGNRPGAAPSSARS